MSAGVRGNVSQRIILDLCGGSGAWSAPYRAAGYDVRLVTLPEQDVRLYVPPERVHGVLAAPPCDHLSVSGAQYWRAKDKDGRTFEALAVVKACLDIIGRTRPVWWALENPVGRLRRFLGPPVMTFHPWEYGDGYVKRTCLWGKFQVPQKEPVAPDPDPRIRERIWRMPPGPNRSMLRSVTPQGFARAFYAANP